MANEAQPEIRITDEGQVRTLTIDRPERASSPSRSLTAELVDRLLQVGEDHDARAIVITGAGDRSFSGGSDVKEIGERDTSGVRYRPRMRQTQRGVHEVLWETA